LSDKPGQPGKLTFLIGVALVSLLIVSTYSPVARAVTEVRFLHLSPDSGPVEIWIDGRLIDQNLTFEEDTDYVEVNPGKHRIICKTKNGPEVVVLNSPFPFREEKEYTVSLTGKLERNDLQLVFITDSCPPNRNLAQLKFTNAVPESIPVDLSIKYGPTLYSNLAFRTGGGCQLIPPDSYLFQLTSSRTGEERFERELKLEAGIRYNVFAAASQDGGRTEFITLTKQNIPEEVPKIFGIERSVLQLLGAGLIASLVILVIGR